MSSCSMFFLVSGIASCVDGGPKMATVMCLIYTTAVMAVSWSTMETAIPQYLELLVPKVILLLFVILIVENVVFICNSVVVTLVL